MRPKLTSKNFILWCLAIGFASAFQMKLLATDAEMKVEAQLVWGCNKKESPDPKHKPVSEEVRKKLLTLPLKWTNYFEVNRKLLSIPVAAQKREVLSEKCSVEVKNLGKSKVEVLLFGKGEQVEKRTQDFPRGETLVLAGRAPEETTWLVVLKRLE
jgi:hypothetical protein